MITEEQKKINKLRSHIRYYKSANREYKRMNILLRKKTRYFYIKAKELKKDNIEKNYLIIELLKKVSEINGKR